MSARGHGRAFQRSAEEISQGILASVSACRSLVAAIAEKKISVVLPPNVHAGQIRYAPHFGRGVGKGEVNVVPYTLTTLAELTGAGYAQKGQKRLQGSKWLRVAMMLLEAEERGIIEPDTFRKIAECAPGYRVNSLLKMLKTDHKVYDLLEKTSV